MKKLTTLFFMTYSLVAASQVLCIQCHHQNARVYTDTTNLIMNGGFENTTCIPDVFHLHSFCPNSLIYDCNFSNWICTGGGTSTYASLLDSSIAAQWNISIITEGLNAAYFGNYFCNVCSPLLNDTSCLSNLGCEVVGIPTGYPLNDTAYGGPQGLSLSQTVSGLIPGNDYVLEFWTGGEWQATFNEEGLFAVDIGFGNIFLRTPPTPPVTGVGKRYVIVFNATATSHVIKFTNWGHIGGHLPDVCSELILDDVHLIPLNPNKGTNPCTVGIEESIMETEVEIFPNPTTGELRIKNYELGIKSITITNVLGHRVYESQISNLKSQINLDITTQPSGIYFIQLKTNKGTVNKKIIKE